MNIETLIPDHITSLQPYIAGKTVAEVKQRYQPDQISKLASNENRLGCSDRVVQAVKKALETVHDYPDPVARRLREKIARLHNVLESEILLAAGSESIISILCRTFFNERENAVTVDATFVGFFVQAGVCGVTLKKVPLTDDYQFDLDTILESVDANTKMVYLANPNNPTGTYISKKEYEILRSGLPENVLLIIDEAYHEYADSVKDYPDSLQHRQENIITLRTFSKAYGLAGLRVGYAIADERLIRQMMKTKLTFEPTSLAQAAALVALDDQEFIRKSIETVEKGKRQLYDFFEQQNVNYVRSISNSVLMLLDSPEEAINVTQRMLEQGVILRRTEAFGLPNCIRITIGTEREMNHFEESFLNLAEVFNVQ